MRCVIVTGTDTGVGKTIVAASLAVALRRLGRDVGYVKPTQTGVDSDEPTDAERVRQLSGLTDIHEHVRLPEPLAPDTAAARAGVAIPTVREHARRIGALGNDVVLVEGAGGVRVRLDSDGRTLGELAVELEPYAEVVAVVVARAGLGTLNHTDLTVRELAAGGTRVAGIVIGSWPADPDLAMDCNLTDLPRTTGVPVLATVPAGAGALDPAAFQALATRWWSSLP
ncbi:MAG: dethiobiotin synthase [Nocardioidaceae bacterium]